MPSATITSLAQHRARRELETAAEAGRPLIESLVADYHTGRGLVDDESACIWTLADLLEESCDWTDTQRRAVAATLQREVLRRVKGAGR